MTDSHLQFDPLSPEFAADPYSFYAKLRQYDGPVWFEKTQMWMLSRYDDVSSVATHPASLRSLDGYASAKELAANQKTANWHNMPYHERVVQFSLLDSDGPTHRRLRKQVFGAFTKEAIEDMETVVRPFVRGLLNDLSVRETFDFTNDFALHVPGFLIGTLLGVPQQDHAQLRIWSEHIVRFFDVDRSETLKQKAEASTREFYYYLRDLMTERGKQPRDDLISKMLANREVYESDDEFISTCMLILMAGHGSTIDVLGSGMHTLIKHPDAMSALRKNPTRLPTAIQEIFRFEPPLPFFHRHVMKEITLGDRIFEAGTTFGLLYASANRDETAFEQADQFKYTRSPNRHLAFGFGAHLCLGNNLARMNMRVIFEELLTRFSLFELPEEVNWKRGLSVRGPERMIVHMK